MKVVAFKIEKDLLLQLEAFAIKHGLNRSEAIRLAIRRLLEEDRSGDKPDFTDYEADMKPLEPEQFIDFDKVLEGDLE